MRSTPAASVTVAIALALCSGCAVAPSPSAPVASPATASSTLTQMPSAAGDGAVLLIAWQTGDDGAELLLAREGGVVERRPLPAVANGQVAAGLGGPLYFLSGPPLEPVLWTSEGSLSEPRWTSQRLFPPKPQEEPLVWLCAGPGQPPGAIAVQSNDNLLYLLGDGGQLRLLPPRRLFLRPGGCAWSDAGHLLVSTDEPLLTHHIAFAMFSVEDGASRILEGIGGEQPAVSEVSLAYVARGGPHDNVVLVGVIPAPDGALPPAGARVEPTGTADFIRPILSADGRRITVVEFEPPGGPDRLLLYELLPSPTLVMVVDVRGMRDAGPVWVASRGSG